MEGEEWYGYRGIAGEMRECLSASIKLLLELGNWANLEGCLSSCGTQLA